MTKKNFFLSFHYNGANSYLFVNGTEIYKFKAKDSEETFRKPCLGNISKDWQVDNMKKTGLHDYVYDFSVDYDAIDVDNVVDIHKYLMKKMTWCNKMFEFVKKCFYRINNFIKFCKRKFIKLYFNEQTRMQSKATNY